MASSKRIDKATTELHSIKINIITAKKYAKSLITNVLKWLYFLLESFWHWKHPKSALSNQSQRETTLAPKKLQPPKAEMLPNSCIIIYPCMQHIHAHYPTILGRKKKGEDRQ